MNKDNIIDKFKEFERFGSRLGLERMGKIMELLGNPQEDLKCIHVAGTNGKGSVCKYIYEVLEENGYCVGLFTSPFLEVFNERIEFHRQYISDEDLEVCTNAVFEKVDRMLELGFDSPTEFEVLTACAFVYFKMKGADYVVLEVGLGGSGDSTNIITKPLACVITSISYDHMDRLGNTLEQIAGEKAGILKQGVPVIVHVDRPEAAKIIAKKAYDEKCVLYDVRKYQYQITHSSIEGYTFHTKIEGTDYRDVEISMLGQHQLQNAMTALVTLEILRKKEEIKVERSRLYAGLKKAKQIGRFEILERNPFMIIDGAHNEAGAEALEKTMKDFLSGKKVLMVTGMLADKDTDKILEHFTHIAEDFIATEPQNPRKMECEELAAELRRRGKNCIAALEPEEALKKVFEQKDAFEVILFAGSLYLIGRIRGILEARTPEGKN